MIDNREQRADRERDRETFTDKSGQLTHSKNSNGWPANSRADRTGSAAAMTGRCRNKRPSIETDGKEVNGAISIELQFGRS